MGAATRSRTGTVETANRSRSTPARGCVDSRRLGGRGPGVAPPCELSQQACEDSGRSDNRAGEQVADLGKGQRNRVGPGALRGAAGGRLHGHGGVGFDGVSEEAIVSQGHGVPGAETEWAPAGIDTSVAHSARMYDWWLGGKDNFAADRAMGDAFARAIPTIRTMARENRAFMHRATRYLAGEAGIRQFLDIGTGIPTRPNLHETAQEIAPDARVVYVDNDPIVLVHARALMVSSGAGRTEYIDADLGEPEKILSNPSLTRTLDLSRPVGLMLVAVLMLLENAQDPWGNAAVLMDALPSGSYVAITHPGQDFNPDAMAGIVAAAQQGHMTVVPRVRDEVVRFFGDWELVEPGVVPVMAWRPDGEPPADPNAAYYWAGVARKP